MGDIGEIVKDIKSIINLMKDVGKAAVRSRDTKDIRSILRAAKVAVEETKHYTLLSKNYKKRNIDMEMEISEMKRGISQELDQYI